MCNFYSFLFTGVKATSMNVHLLHHLPQCVRLWGPIWAYSCFHFESLNGFLKSLFHGTKDMTKQVKSSLLYIYISVPCIHHVVCMPIQMAFSYVELQALPPTQLTFQTCTNSVSTLANILYGTKKYVLHSTLCQNHCNIKFHDMQSHQADSG